MPKNKVNDLITDQEMTFAHLVLSGTMTDRQAAETAGLNPESAAYIKAKPRVRAYMAEHRAALHEKLLAEESEGLRKLNVGRDQVLAHLWYLATLPPEVTRGNINGQLKATAMFAAFGGLFPQAQAAQPQPSPAEPKVKAYIYESEWHREQREKEANQQSNPAVAQQEEPARPSAEPAPAAAPDDRNAGLNAIQNSVQNSILNHGPQTASASGPVSDPPRPHGTRIPTFAELASSRFTSLVPDTSSGPDLRVPFSIDKTRFGNPNGFRNRR
jgi:hypothetical protein